MNKLDGKNVQLPNQCPVCKHRIKPEELYTNDTSGHDSSIWMLLQCPSCHSPFIAFFKWMYGPISSSYCPTVILPHIPDTHNFENTIEKMSPKFVDIYNQALAAETYALTELCGMGYRKALEFLITDYVLYKEPASADRLLSKESHTNLSVVIGEYIDSTKIKNTAKAAVWLGNDYTHYTRKWEDRDVQDMKKFIDACVYYIQMEITLEDAESMVVKK